MKEKIKKDTNENIGILPLDLEKELIEAQKKRDRKVKKRIVRCPRCGFEHEYTGEVEVE